MKKTSKAFAFPCQGGDYSASEIFSAYGVDAEYSVNCRSDEPFTAEFSGKCDTVQITLQGDWLVDLMAKEYTDSMYVLSKGMSFAEKRPFDNKELHGIWIRSLHTPDGIFFDAVTSRFPEKLPFIIKGQPVFLKKEDDNHTSFYSGNLKISQEFDHISSDICDPGKALTVGKNERIAFTSSSAKCSKLRLYGAVSLEAEVRNGTAEFSVNISEKGIGPIVAVSLDEDGQILGFEFFYPLVLATTLKTADFRLNGSYIEYLRSLLLRRIGYSMPEEEPRGELVYPFSMWIRNYTGQTLSSFGFEEEAYEYLKLLDDILIQDGYLKQSYGLSLIPNSDDLGTMGNDGMGYYLWCWGKLMNRYPAKKPSLHAIDRCIRWLKFHTRWNGLIQDGTEPVDLFTSSETDGCLYTQGIVISGLKVLSGAYRNLKKLTPDEENLVKNMEEYAERLISAVQFRYRNTEFFDEYSTADAAVRENNYNIFDPGLRGWVEVIWSNIGEKYLHAYSVLQPGALFDDPEGKVDGFDSIIEQTMRKVAEERCCDYNDKLLYVHFPRVDAYSQLGAVLNLLYMNQPNRAYDYLDAFVSYWGLTKLTYILPECIETRSVGKPNDITKMSDSMKEKSETYPFLYPGSSNQPETGYFRAPGNLIHVGYLFYIYDVMIGISVSKNGLVLTPRIPDKLFPVKLSGYHTPWGTVDMEADRQNNNSVVKYTVHTNSGDSVICVENLSEEKINFTEEKQ